MKRNRMYGIRTSNRTRREKGMQTIRKIPMAERLIADFSFRTLTFTYISLAVNIVLTVAKGVAGWFSSSWWLITLSAYYLILCMTRILLLRESRKTAKLKSERERQRAAWKAYRICGVLLLGMTLVFFGVVALIMSQGNTFVYDGVLIFAVAMWDFYCLITAIVYMIRMRGKHTPIIVAIRTLKFATALVSMLSLQTAMFASFGGDSQFQDAMNLATGSAVSLLLLATALAMLIKANKQLKTQKEMETPQDETQRESDGY